VKEGDRQLLSLCGEQEDSIVIDSDGAGLDVFISNDIISFSSGDGPVASADNKISASPDFHPSDYYSRIFHPPLV
jgi:hypothetical protein